MAKVIGIDIGSREIKAVAMRGGRGRAAVTRADRFQLPAGCDLKSALEAATPWLRQFLAGQSGAMVVAAVPPGEAVVKILELPPSSGATLNELLKFEAEHNIPFASDRASMDHATLKLTADSTTVLLACARREIVQQISECLRAAGGKSKRVTVSAPARLGLPTLQHIAATPAQQVTAVVDVNGDNAEIVLAVGGALSVSRAVRFSANGSENGNTRLTEAALEIRRTVQAHRATHRGATLGRVLLCGSGSSGEGAPKFLESELQAPVSRIDPWEGLGVFGPATQVPSNERSAYAAATGLALQGMGRGLQLNLIPEQDRSTMSPATRRSIMRISGFLVASLSLVVWLATNPLSPLSASNQIEQSLNDVTLQLTGKSPGPTRRGQVDTTRNAAALQSLTDEIKRDSVLWLEVLRLLSENMPDGIKLTELSMEKGQSVVIRGSAKDSVNVAEALNSLQTMPMFIDARISYSNSTTVADLPRSEFEIIATLEPLPGSKGGARRR